jgi:multiple sugar transport system substrate-binding protein
MIHEKLIDAWNGNKTTEEVCKDIEKEMNSMLASE